ncbi:hypothetical protein [Magnetococcus sp. PR-3]|uniref:hypothetical protein n=1 Tax=Magnetococcus sp. PR-3 TaxID=3120355 RepID=UPI002FCE08B0
MKRSLTASLLLLLCTPALAAEIPVNVRMQNVVKTFSLQTGHRVAGLGSWISGKNYRPFKSDHDLRMLVPKGTPPKKAAKMWRHAQKTLRNLIKKEFGNDAVKILNETNFYPPNQLMNGLNSADDALGRFQQLKSMPNLGYQGKITPNTPAKYFEGLYGKGARQWAQQYEREAGRLFYSNKGKVAFMGSLDQVHLQEGLARYTPSGMGNTAGQWADKLLDEIRGGDPKKISKYLKRVNNDLKKARELAKLPKGSRWFGEVERLAGELDDLAKANLSAADRSKALGKLSLRARTLHRQAVREAGILKHWDKASKGQKVMLHYLMDSNTKQEGWIKKMAKNVPWGQVVKGLLTYVNVLQTSRALGEADDASALYAQVPMLITSLPASVIATITVEFLESAKGLGYRTMAMTQDAWDLLDGIYSAGGRAGSSENRRFSLDDLVQLVPNEARLQGLVYYLALKSTDRGIGQETGKYDEKVGQEVYARVYPKILAAWKARREQLQQQIQQHAAAPFEHPILLTYSPAPARLGAKGEPVTVQVRSSLSTKTVNRSHTTLKKLYGKLSKKANPWYNISYDWNKKDGGTSKAFTFSQPGTYPISLQIHARAGMKGMGSHTAWGYERKTTAMVEVVVLGAEQEKDKDKKASKKPSAPSVQKHSSTTSTPPAMEWQPHDGATAPFEKTPASQKPKDPCALTDAQLARIDHKLAGISPSRMASLAIKVLPEKKRKRVLNCICRVHSGASGSVSVWYDTQPVNNSPSCKDLSNGPCVASGFGCWRTPFKPDKKALDQCRVNLTLGRQLCEAGR